MSSKQLDINEKLVLFDLLRILFSRKKLIFVITAFFVCVAVVYIFVKKPLYQVESSIFPHSIQNGHLHKRVDAESHDRLNLRIKDAFLTFGRNIQISNLNELINSNRKVLQAKNVPSNNEMQEYFRKLTFFPGNDEVKVRLTGVNKEKIDVWLSILDVLVELVIEQTKNQIMDFNRLAVLKLEKDVAVIKRKYTRIYELKLRDLRNQLQIAKKLGVHDNPLLPGLNRNTYKNTVILGLSGFMRGTKVIQEEINVLKNMSLKDIMDIEDYVYLEELQQKITLHKNFDVKKFEFIDKEIKSNISIVSLKKSVVLLLSILLGLTTSVLIIFLLESKKRFNASTL